MPPPPPPPPPPPLDRYGSVSGPTSPAGEPLANAGVRVLARLLDGVILGLISFLVALALFGRDSYNNAGAQLKSSVHYSTNYCNAFWNGSQMVYGDGNSSQNCLPLARAQDVTAHELTHAVTENESGLVYSGESGGLNEAMSDIDSLRPPDSPE